MIDINSWFAVGKNNLSIKKKSFDLKEMSKKREPIFQLINEQNIAGQPTSGII